MRDQAGPIAAPQLFSAMRCLVFDRTAPRLRHAWRTGSWLYRGLGRLDAVKGVASWGEALSWLAEQTEPIEELQYWGHGKWGRALVGDESLDASALAPSHALHAGMQALRAQLAPRALVWFRTCETFGAHAGHDFAVRLSEWLGARVAGHTYIIGFHQSGLHGLEPGARPDWSADEALVEGTPDAPVRAAWSSMFAPRTITALAGRVPARWFVTAPS